MDLSNPEVAYLMGFLWADGSCTPPGKIVYRLTLGIKTEDYHALSAILDKVGWVPRHIKMHGYPTTMMSGGHKAYHAFLVAHDYHEKSRCAPTKILAALSDEVRHYWWRGFYDGDGSFNLQSNSGSLCIAAPYDQDWGFFIDLCERLQITYTIERNLRKCGNVSLASIRNKRGLMTFCDYIYAGQPMGLTRKREKYEAYRRRIDEANVNRITPFRGVCRMRSCHEMKIRVKGSYIRERFPLTDAGQVAAARRYDELERMFRGQKAILNFND